MSITPQLHSTVTQTLGQQSLNFSASFFTGQKQRVFPSTELVTVLSEISVKGANKAAFPPPQVQGDSVTQRGGGETATASTESAGGGGMPDSGHNNNCSWSDTSGERCSVAACLSYWQRSEQLSWQFSSLQGHISDILSSGLRTISPIVQMEVDAAFDSFGQRMSQSTSVSVGAVYQLDDPAVCRNAVTDLPCYTSSSSSQRLFSYWFLPRSGVAYVGDLRIPIGGTARGVVEQMLPSCAAILKQLQATPDERDKIKPSDNLTAGLKATNSNIESWLLAASPHFDYPTALSPSRPDRVICAHELDQDFSVGSLSSSSSSSSSSSLSSGLSQTYYGANIVAVVPIVRNRRDVIFTKNVEIRVCVNNHYQATRPGECGMRFVQGVHKCGLQRVTVDRDYSLMLSICSYIGLGVAIMSTLALIFGASAIMIAIDAQLLAVIAQGSCSSSVSRPATLFLQQFLFLGRAVETENTTVAFYSSIVGWLIAFVSIAIFVHGMVVLLVSLIWRTLLKRAKAEASSSHSRHHGNHSPPPPPLSPASAGDAKSGSGDSTPATTTTHFSLGARVGASKETASGDVGGSGKLSILEKILVALNVNSAATASATLAAADEAASASSSSTGAKRKQSGATAAAKITRANALRVVAANSSNGDFKNNLIAQGFALEERRILARSAAALRFPSGSLCVVLVGLQGLWFAAVNVWWYSASARDSMPGIVGCLFALLMTLIILVLARQTRLIFTPYSWLHPEQAAVEARDRALEVSDSVHRRSTLFYRARSWFFPFGTWGPTRPRQRMGALFRPVRSRGWIGVPFLVSLLTCITVCIYPITVLGCCAQQMFLSMFFFAVALVVWKSQPLRAPYANTMFVAVRAALSFLCFARTIVLVTEDAYFDAAHFILIFLVQALILVVGVIDVWCGLMENWIWLPHLEHRQTVIRARTGGALRQQRLQEEEAALGGAEDDGEGGEGEEGGAGGASEQQQQQRHFGFHAGGGNPALLVSPPSLTHLDDAFFSDAAAAFDDNDHEFEMADI